MRRALLIGAVAGGVVGGTTGALVDRNKRPRGALIGGLSGLAAGAGMGFVLGIASSIPRTPSQLARRVARFGVDLTDTLKPVVEWSAETVLDVVVPAIDRVAGSAADLLDSLDARDAARRS